MAYTRIHAVKATVQKAVDYICDPGKTEGKLYISSFGCAPETAQFDFRFALSKTDRDDKNLAYHLIQSFAPGEVLPQEAHQIGIELADRLLEGKYSYIVSTHVDRGHVHSHIIFCAADNVEHRKYNDCTKSYYLIRSISDDLCREHGLSVISPGKKKGKSYTEWKAEKQGNSWKATLRRDIENTISASISYEDFLSKMRVLGYEVKGGSLSASAPKYISFRAAGQEHFIRGSQKNFGKGFTKEEIKERIENRLKKKEKEQADALHPKAKIPKRDILKRTNARSKLIDTSGEKFQESPGLRHWANVQNLKTAAASYVAADSIPDLERKLEETRLSAKKARSDIAAIDRHMKETGELLRYARQYHENLPYQKRYEKSKDPDRYLRMHESQLILFSGAERMLKRMGIEPSAASPATIQEDYLRLRNEKAKFQQACQAAEKEVKKMEQQIQNLEQYLHVDLTKKQEPRNTRMER